MADAGVLTLEQSRPPVLKALRRLKGRATLGDITAATGLEQARAEQALKSLLEDRRGHLEVGEAGDLVYRFDEKLLSRDAEPLWTKVKRGAWKAFKVGFKIWIAAMLLIYFVIFVALLLAAMFAGNRDGEGGGWGGGEGGGRRGGGLPIGDLWLIYWLWSPGWRRRPYYGEGYGDDDLLGSGRGRRGRRRGPPFYKKVFAFVFGPDEPERTREERDREHLRFIRARAGVVSTADFVQYTGLEVLEADEELARLMAAHDGDVEVTDDGTLVYTFPSLMVSAHGQIQEREPAPAWRRLEPRQPVTGNSVGTNVLVGGINSFNLVAAASAPLFIFPRLGIGGLGAEIALIWVPVAFSATFFAVPAVRALGVAKENARRGLRNVRKVLLGMVSRTELEADEPRPLDAAEAKERTTELLKGKVGADLSVDPVLDRLVAEFDGEVEVGEGGTPRFRFPDFRRQMSAAHKARLGLALQERSVGEIVYASDDDAATAADRELAAFDRALDDGSSTAGAGALAAGDEPGAEPVEGATHGGAAEPGADDEAPRALPPADDLTAYLNDPLKVAVRDERELAAMQAAAAAREG